MKDKIVYRDGPIGKVQIVPDFLPSPAELAFRDESTKVTLALSSKSVAYFKAQAAKHNAQYQNMIRRLVDAYVEAQGAKPKRAPRPRHAARA
jgi:hypothetical protein